MLKQIPKVLLLVALLVTFAVSSAPAFAAFARAQSKKTCLCTSGLPKGGGGGGGCHFDAATFQCINFGCKVFCFLE
jgi:hypothetical protein